MVRSESVARGLAAFVDKEILPKTKGWQKWALGAAAGLAARRADTVMEAVRTHPAAKALGVVDAEGNIDDEAVFDALMQQAEKSPAVIEIPMLGELTLTASDVGSLHRLIREADGKSV